MILFHNFTQNKINMLKNVPLNQIMDRIRFENPWWVTGSIEEDYSKMSRRAYFDLLFPLITETEIRRSVVLMGPRRIGKTVMLYHAVQALIDQGVSPKKILFITVENPIYNNIALEQLFENGREATGAKDVLDGWYVIFDEIQYLKNWEVHLKSLVDSYRKSKFIVSGSAAAALKFKSNESGAGRFTDFMLPPLTFHEFLGLQGLGDLMQRADIPWGKNNVKFYNAADTRELNRHFMDYINFGGYPEAIFSDKIRANPERFIRHDVVDKVLLRDLPGLYGINDVQELNSLFTTIAYNSGNEYSMESLTKQSGVAKNTIKKYLEYLEAAFLIKTVRRVDQSGKRFQRDNFFKTYLTNPSLRSALFSPLTPTDEWMGNMTETAIFAQWMHRDGFTPWYARWNNGEVDMVGLNRKNLKPSWALEIKWSNRYFDHPRELKSLIKFCQENQLDNALVTTIDKQGVVTEAGIDISFIPAAAYAYTVGINTLEQKQ